MAEVPDEVKLNLPVLMRHLGELSRAVGAAGVRRFVEYARAAQQLQTVLRDVNRVGLEWDGPAGEVLLTWERKDGRVFAARGLDLPDALQSCEPAGDGKVCAGQCKQWKPLTAFGADRQRPDGKNPACKKCETIRQRKYKPRRREKHRQRTQGGGNQQ